MNVSEIKNEIMFQTNNDVDDIEDFLPYLLDYINEGYDLLVFAFANAHVSEDSETYTPLKNDRAVPEIPEWAHRGIVDYATYLVYRNGSIQKQNRGQAYLARFKEVENRLSGMTAQEKGLVDENGKSTVTKYGRKIINIPW